MVYHLAIYAHVLRRDQGEAVVYEWYFRFSPEGRRDDVSADSQLGADDCTDP